MGGTKPPSRLGTTDGPEKTPNRPEPKWRKNDREKRVSDVQKKALSKSDSKRPGPVVSSSDDLAAVKGMPRSKAIKEQSPQKKAQLLVETFKSDTTIAPRWRNICEKARRSLSLEGKNVTQQTEVYNAVTGDFLISVLPAIKDFIGKHLETGLTAFITDAAKRKIKGQKPPKREGMINMLQRIDVVKLQAAIVKAIKEKTGFKKSYNPAIDAFALNLATAINTQVQENANELGFAALIDQVLAE